MIITGDWHSTFVNDIKEDFSDPDSATVASEFVGTSISTNDDAIVYGPYYGPMIPANRTSSSSTGTGAVTSAACSTGASGRTDLRTVPTVSRPDAPVSTFASFVVEDGRPGAQLV